MTLQQDRAKLREVKLALAKKYLNLSQVVNSKPRRKNLLNHVERFRRQAADLSR